MYLSRQRSQRLSLIVDATFSAILDCFLIFVPLHSSASATAVHDWIFPFRLNTFYKMFYPGLQILSLTPCLVLPSVIGILSRKHTLLL